MTRLQRRQRVRWMVAAAISLTLVAVVVLAPTAYLHMAYEPRTLSSVRCGPGIGCVFSESTSYTKRVAWLPGPDRLPQESVDDPLLHLIWRGADDATP